MQLKTTYLLGAGASANALPVVAQLADKVDEVFNFVRSTTPSADSWGEYKVTQRGEVIVNFKDLHDNWGDLDSIQKGVVEELKNNQSIDTLAKLYYSFDRHEHYIGIKSILIACFMFWERDRKLDFRYNNFWATLASVKKQTQSDYTFQGFKGNIDILSWNYDSQLESSLTQIVRKSKWPFHEKIADKIFVGRDTGFNPRVYKLNGTARLGSEIEFNLEASDAAESEWRFKYALASVILFPERFESLKNLCFSWEEGTCGTSDIALAQVKCADTSTLVVIGYSFPTLNTDIDYALVYGMAYLKKVYFQGKDIEDSKRIMEHFIAINGYKDGVTYSPITSPGFFIPPEVTISHAAEIAVW